MISRSPTLDWIVDASSLDFSSAVQLRTLTAASTFYRAV
jgi:hypothetical protein